jgi:hypothetical protein
LVGTNSSKQLVANTGTIANNTSGMAAGLSSGLCFSQSAPHLLLPTSALHPTRWFVLPLLDGFAHPP